MSTGRCSIPVPTRRRAGSPTSAGRRCASGSWTADRVCSPATAPTMVRHVSWGSPDFVAAEEMGRFRGYWWSPDGESIAACRVDEAPVAEWVIADPATPSTPARTVRYPAAGTDNAIVTLHILGLDGTRVDVDWDREFFPYVATVDWTEAGLLMSVVVTRPARFDDAPGRHHDGRDRGARPRLRRRLGRTRPGLPRLLADGRLVTAGDRDGARRLLVDGEPVTPVELQLRSVIDTSRRHHRVPGEPDRRRDRAARLEWTDGALIAVTTEPGVHTAVVGGTDDRRAFVDARRAGCPRDHARRSPPRLVRRAAARCPPTCETLRRRRTRHRHRRAPPPRPRRIAAPGVARPLRRPARPPRPAFVERLRVGAVVRRPGIRRGRRRRSRYARARSAWERVRPPRPRHRAARRPDRGAARGRRSLRRACSTSIGWPSAAGVSVASSPRWPCCAGRTCSTPPSPALP